MRFLAVSAAHAFLVVRLWLALAPAGRNEFLEISFELVWILQMTVKTKDYPGDLVHFAIGARFLFCLDIHRVCAPKMALMAFASMCA